MSVSELKRETLLQCLERLAARPSLFGLDKDIFPQGPLPREVVEITGHQSVGKTLLILHLVKNSILPPYYMDHPLGGLAAGVVLLNTDLHFNINLLVKLMKCHLKKRIPGSGTKRRTAFDEIVASSLNRLTVLNIYNSESLYTTFYLLERLLSENKGISLIALDSISSFYWERKGDKDRKTMDAYLRDVLSRLHKCIGDAKVTLVFSRPSYFKTKGGNVNCSSEYNLLDVNTSITLLTHLNESGSSHIAQVRGATTFFLKYYSITEEGICWSI